MQDMTQSDPIRPESSPGGLPCDDLGRAYNDTPAAPRVRRGGRAPVAILRPRQSQRAAVCQRPACRVPWGGAKHRAIRPRKSVCILRQPGWRGIVRHRPVPGGERQIGRYSFFKFIF